MIFNEEGYIDLFGFAHIIYMIVMILLFIFGIYYLRKVKNKILLIRILGAILLVLILLNRYACASFDVANKENQTYLNLIPHSFCGMTSLVLAICAIFYKKNNVIIESLFVFSFFGGVSNIFYPTYITYQYIWELRTWTGLLHHALSAFLMLYLFAIKEINPSFKKCYYFIIASLIMIAIGYFEHYVLGIIDCMNLDVPLISSLPLLSTGWFLCLELFVLYLIFLVVLEFIRKKKIKNQ